MPYQIFMQININALTSCSEYVLSRSKYPTQDIQGLYLGGGFEGTNQRILGLRNRNQKIQV